MRNPFSGQKLLLASVCIAMAGVSTRVNSAESLAFNWISYGITNRDKPNAVTGLGTTDSRAQQALFEHYGANDWGSMYFGLISTNGHGVGSVVPFGYSGKPYEMYAVAVPAVSLAKLTGKSFTFGPIADVQLMSSLQQNSAFHYQAAEFGVNLAITAPGIAVFDTGLLTHDSWIDFSAFGGGTHERLDKNKWVWRTYIVSKAIDIGNHRFNFNLQSYINTSGNGPANRDGTKVVLITDYLWNIGGNSDYQIGLRHWFTRSKSSPSTSVPYLFFKYTL